MRCCSTLPVGGGEAAFIKLPLAKHSLGHIIHYDSHEFEVPDVIGFRDFSAFSAEFLGELATRRHSAEKPYLFPFSDGGKLRQLSVLSCADLVVFNSAAALIASTTDPLLSDAVFSTRLYRGPPAWKLHPYPKWYAKFRASAVLPLRDGTFSAMRVEDIADFFGSIQLPVLLKFLTDRGCSRRAIECIAAMLNTWRNHHNLVGLPIGMDGSRLLANALLMVVDQAIQAAGGKHRRWMDDLLLLARTLSECKEAADAAAAALSDLRLKFSPGKSLSFDNPREAIAHVEERMIASLASLRGHPAFRGAVEHRWREFEAGAYALAARPFRYLLHQLEKHDSRAAVRALVSDPELANIDARTAGRYLLAAGSLSPHEVDRAMACLEHPQDDRRDGLDLHLLRALSEQKLGSAEGDAFWRIALDESRRAPLRCWAFKAMGNTPTWNEREVLEATEAEQEPMVRRAGLVPLHGRPSPSGRRFLRDHRADPTLRYAVRWVEAA